MVDIVSDHRCHGNIVMEILKYNKITVIIGLAG